MHPKISFFENSATILNCNPSSISVKLNLNHQTLLFLVDTGASISAIEHKHIISHNIPIYKEQITIKGIGGIIKAIGYVNLVLSAENQSFNHKFYVFNSLPIKANAILGDDFLRKYRSMIDYDSQTLALNDTCTTYLPILHHPDNTLLYIPSRSESIHFLETNMQGDCVVCSKEVCEGVFIAGSIVRPTDGKIPIQILNTTDKDLSISDIKPDVHSLHDYDMCSFSSTERNADRVKRLFSLLNIKHLNKEEQIAIENICAKFSDVFYLPNDKLTTTNVYEQNIILKPNAEPVYVKPYRLPYSQKAEIKKQIDQMLNEGIIEPSKSEWSSPVLLVPKKTDIEGKKKWRLVIDYRKLNNTIQDDRYPLPNIAEIIDSLSGSIYFSHLDLNSGYYQVNLEKDCRKYTAFCSGQYQMTRMPMGLKTSPSAFSRMMNIAMTGLTYEKCLVYLDDLIVFGKNLHDHNKNLLDVFQRLRKCNLKLNPVKCDFLKKEVLYLGHVVSGNGVLPDPQKI